jgi:menaquinone-dependent protoporphyrinogen oxidase
MMDRTHTLVVYGSRHGSTREVATAIAADLRASRHDVDLLSAGAATVAGPAGYDSVVLGGSLYMGRWHADSSKFVRRHHDAVVQLRLAVFALGPRTLETEAVTDSRKQLDAALARLDVEPELVAIFGGVIEPAALHFPFSRMPRSDARDWQAIDAWSSEVAAMISCRESALVN